MFTNLLLPDAAQLHFDAFRAEANILTLVVTSIQPTATCPSCAESSSRIHSRYQRTLADLPCSGRAVQIQLQVRRFYCANGACPRVTFSERLPTVVAPSARRTVRLAQEQSAIGFDLGGEAGARLAQRQGCR